MFGVLFFTLSLTLVCASDRRLVNQIKKLREGLSYVNSDISSLFQRLDMLNETMWSNELGSSMKSREDRALELVQAERMDMLDIKNRLDAEMKTRHSEFSDMLERTNRLNLQLSEEAKALKQSNSDLRKELDQLRMNCETIKDEFSEFKTQFEFNYAAMQDEFLTKAQYQINYSAMKNKFSELAKTTTTIVDFLNMSCKNTKKSGVYYIPFENSVKSPTSVYCDANTDGGGWIVIMRRQDGSVNFNRTWTEYKNGFGNLDGEFWIGNDFIHQLTNSKPTELRVDMEYEHGKGFVKYAVFKVGSEADKYVLTVSGYSGPVGDSLDNVSVYGTHNGMKFSTFDQDNDRYKSWNCAGGHGGGWWYNACYNVLLTGTYGTGTMNMRWYDGGRFRLLKFAEMKIR